MRVRLRFQAAVLGNVARGSAARRWEELSIARAHLELLEVASEPSSPTAAMSNIMPCSTDTSPAATARKGFDMFSNWTCHPTRERGRLVTVIPLRCDIWASPRYTVNGSLSYHRVVGAGACLDQAVGCSNTRLPAVCGSARAPMCADCCIPRYASRTVIIEIARDFNRNPIWVIG